MNSSEQQAEGRPQRVTKDVPTLPSAPVHAVVDPRAPLDLLTGSMDHLAFTSVPATSFNIPRPRDETLSRHSFFALPPQERLRAPSKVAYPTSFIDDSPVLLPSYASPPFPHPPPPHLFPCLTPLVHAADWTPPGPPLLPCHLRMRLWKRSSSASLPPLPWKLLSTSFPPAPTHSPTLPQWPTLALGHHRLLPWRTCPTTRRGPKAFTL